MKNLLTCQENVLKETEKATKIFEETYELICEMSKQKKDIFINMDNEEARKNLIYDYTKMFTNIEEEIKDFRREYEAMITLIKTNIYAEKHKGEFKNE